MIFISWILSKCSKGFDLVFLSCWLSAESNKFINLEHAYLSWTLHQLPPPSVVLSPSIRKISRLLPSYRQQSQRNQSQCDYFAKWTSISLHQALELELSSQHRNWKILRWIKTIIHHFSQTWILWGEGQWNVDLFQDSIQPLAKNR